MEFTGLLRPYHVNRPLTDDEQVLQLNQKERLDIRFSHELTVIETNSHWMEVVDKFFFDKGFFSTASMLGIGVNAAIAVFAVVGTVLALMDGNPDALLLLLLVPFGVGLSWHIWTMARKELNYTHYPIRFNRQTKMVHVFRQDGTVLSVKWNQVFFTQVRRSGNAWDIVGHVLADDKLTVLETFALPATAVGSKEKEDMRGYWEFIRRYMEDGPASVYDNITGCLPIKDQKETLAFSYERVAFSLGSYPNVFNFIFYLVYYLFYPGRWLAMRFSKIPQWPAEIEALCPRPEGHDPYFRDASMNP